MSKAPSYRVLALDASAEVRADLANMLSAPRETEDDVEAGPLADDGFVGLFACLAPPAGFPEVDLVLTGSATGALEAVEAAQQTREPFAVAFIELRQNDLEADLQLLEAIRAADADIHLVLLAAAAGPHPLTVAQRVPPVDQLFYLQKPFHSFEVQQLMMSLASRWRAERSRGSMTLGSGDVTGLAGAATAWEGLPGGLIVFDRRDRLVSANPSVQNLLPELSDLLAPGTPYDQLQGEIARRLLPEDTLFLEEAWVKDRLEWHAKSGGVTDLRLRGGRWLLLAEGNGPLGETYCLYFDITGLKRRDQNRASSQRVRQVADALEAFCGELALAADDSGVMTVKDLDRRLFRPASSVSGRKAEAISSNAALAELGQKLRIVTQAMPFLPESLRLDSLVGELVREKLEGLPPEIQLEVVSGAGLWPVDADPALIRATISELIDNALAAMSGKGNITLETENLRLNRDFVASRPALMQGDYVLLVVRDEGVGMTAEQVDRAFNPFFTSVGHAEHPGLGLSMAHGAISQSGGHLEIESEPDRGTSVHLFLPRAKAGTAETREDQDPGPKSEVAPKEDLPESDPNIIR